MEQQSASCVEHDCDAEWGLTMSCNTLSPIAVAVFADALGAGTEESSLQGSVGGGGIGEACSWQGSSCVVVEPCDACVPNGVGILDFASSRHRVGLGHQLLACQLWVHIPQRDAHEAADDVNTRMRRVAHHHTARPPLGLGPSAQ